MNRKNHYRPSLENLERRDVLSMNPILYTNGTLVINCDNANDGIRVQQTATQIVLNNKIAYNVNAVKGIIVNGNGGDDNINCQGVQKPVTLNGGSGNDWLIGGDNNDALNGGSEADTIFGMYGNDTIHGDAGNDRLYGNMGYDSIYGDDGSDFMDDGDLSRNEYYNSGSGADFIADSWAANGTTTSDIAQGQSGTCAFLSGLAAGCDAGIDYTGRIKYIGYDSTGCGIYQVTLWNPSTRRDFAVNVGFDGRTNKYDTQTAVSAPDRIAEFEFWPVLMQRAYMQTLNSTNPQVGLAAATGGPATYYTVNQANAKSDLIRALNQNRPVTLGIDTGVYNGVTHHALTIIKATGSAANPDLLIYNPWGRDFQGAKTTYALDGANDGYFWISWNTLQTYFNGGIYIR